MKKSMYILILCTMLTGCVNYETPTATANSNAYETTVSVTDFTEETVIEITSEVYDATEITEETTVTATETSTEKASETTQSTTQTTTITTITSAEEEKSSIAETEITTITEDAETGVITTEMATTTITSTFETTIETTTTEIIQITAEVTEPQMSDYEKAVIIYEYMTANGSGTCVQYSYQTYQMCREYGLECYFTWTENKLYGHVANVVKVDGAWYVLDTQGGCFLRENMCGFTEIVDEYENYVADADIISGVRYG